MSTFVIGMANHVKEAATKWSELGFFTQIADDWEVGSYTSLKVIDLTDESTNTRCPKDHPHEVIYQVWKGMSLWCDCKTKAGAK